MCVVCALDTATADGPSAAPRLGLSASALADGRALLARHPSVDLHAHPGRFFMAGAPRTAFTDRYPSPSPRRAIAAMREGGVSGALFATVADHAVLGFGSNGLADQRPFAPGEAYADHGRQLDVLDALIEQERLIRDDAVAAHAAGGLAALVAVEGGDFIEDRLDRIAEAAARGVRAITIIHYRTNQLGDTQTQPPTHGGLTALGRDAIRAMEAAGILVDLSHATYEVSRHVAAVASRPLILSHSNVARAGADHPRLISLDHARLVTETGGLVGVVPAGFGQASFADYIETILWMIDRLGIDRIAIGTDMDFTYRPVFADYRDWPAIPAALLARGLTEAEVAQLIGGNALRILSAHNGDRS